MGRLIINNRSDLPDTEALYRVIKVIEIGRISNNDKQYCYLVRILVNNVFYHVVSDLRKKSDSFIIYNEPIQTENGG